ncbi:hypothetical protein ACT3CD_14370 [Geofilum sp. OHC36d9]|uniref:hypothetical protein n=1 Tax=Geofilum sp. OHC36d9 TaxID=3458413 RepID=UPI0040347327
MRTKLFISVLFVAISITTTAQNTGISSSDEMQTIFGSSETQSIGGFGAFETGYTRINNLDAIYIGGRGAIIINHSLAIGAGGKGFISESVYDNNLQNDYEYSGGYGGIILEPILAWRRPVHVTFPILVGAGGISYIKHWGDYDHEENYIDEDSYAFFVFEPSVEIEFNIIKWMRMAITGSYRYTSGIDLEYKRNVMSAAGGFSEARIGPSDMLRSFNIGMSIKFGKF